MGKKSKKDRIGVVYSTNPDFNYNYRDDQYEDTPPPQQQQLRTRIEKKGRGGKVVTFIEGFVGSPDDLETLAKRLKSSCGVGGSVKDGQILIQGDVRQKAVKFLNDWGYKAK